MSELDTWLKQATRRLSQDSIAQVRSEIGEHYEVAREFALSQGAADGETDQLAVGDLGDAKAANRQYRSVLLTLAEARLLREGNWEARALCSRPWLKWLLPAVPTAMLIAATALFMIGSTVLAGTLLAAGAMTSLLFAARFLPIYTPSRGRVFRCAKWIVLVSTLLLAFGLLSPLFYACLWPLASVEWMRISIRRKLPVAQWPKQLYL